MRKIRFINTIIIISILFQVISFAGTAGEFVTDKENTACDVINFKSNVVDYKSGICLSLKTGRNEIYINSQVKKLNNVSYENENCLLFVPLREIVELFGGTVNYIPDDQSVKITLPKMGTNTQEKIYQIWVGKAEVLNYDDGSPKISLRKFSDAPVLKNGCVYVDARFFEEMCHFAYVVEDTYGHITISNLIENLGVEEFVINKNFEQLDKDVQKRFKRFDNVLDDINGEVFSDGEVEITLALGICPPYTVSKNSKLIKKVVVLSDKYCTPRGLRIGDSKEKLIDLYIDAKFPGGLPFKFEVSDGKVKKMIFYEYCESENSLATTSNTTNENVSDLKNDNNEKRIYMNLRVGSNDIYMNDATKRIDIAPFLENNIVYVPLREIVELFGGDVKYIPDDKSVIINIPSISYDKKDCFSQIWIDSSKVVNNGCEESKMSSSMYLGTKAEDYVAKIKECHVFVPLNYFERFDFAEVTSSHNDRICISNSAKENGIDKFIINKDFGLLDKDIQTRFIPTGEVQGARDGSYQETVYTDGDLEIAIATGITPHVPYEGAKIIKRISVISDKYATQMGLRVGDSEERYHDLYVGDITGVPFMVKITNGIVTKIEYIALY